MRHALTDCTNIYFNSLIEGEVKWMLMFTSFIGTFWFQCMWSRFHYLAHQVITYISNKFYRLRGNLQFEQSQLHCRKKFSANFQWNFSTMIKLFNIFNLRYHRAKFELSDLSSCQFQLSFKWEIKLLIFDHFHSAFLHHYKSPTNC